MSILQQTIDDILILKPTGRLDSANSLEFERVLVDILETGQAKLVFDLTDLDYISSAGLRVILLAGKKMRAIKGYLALFGLRAGVDEIFKMSGFHTIFNIYSEMNEAIQHAHQNATESSN